MVTTTTSQRATQTPSPPTRQSECSGPLAPGAETTRCKGHGEGDHMSLICNVAAKYLEYEAARVVSLVADFRSGKRTEKEWDTDLDEDTRQQHHKARQLGARPLQRRSATGPDRHSPTGQRAVARRADTAHTEARHDLMSMRQNPNFPSTLTEAYLSQIISGYMRHGDIAFKSWLHPGGRHEGTGPTVYVSRSESVRSKQLGQSSKTELKQHDVNIRRCSGQAIKLGSGVRPKNLLTSGPILIAMHDHRPRHMLIFLIPPRGGGAYNVGGQLPDLHASDLKLMKQETWLMFEDSSRNFNTHDDLLMQALGLPSVTIFVLANAEFQPGSLERTGARVIVRHPGCRMILLEDVGWQNQKQIAKEIAKTRHDFLLCFLCTAWKTKSVLADRPAFMDEAELAEEADFLDTLPLAGMNYWCRYFGAQVRTHPVSAPPPYEFNHTVSVDALEAADYTGKDDVKDAVLDAQVAKNEFMRVGGVSPTQWVLGRLPRGVGHVLDEVEREQQRHIDATGDDLLLDDPDEPTDDGIGISSPVRMDAEPENEQMDPTGGIQEPMAEDTAAEADVEAEVTEEYEAIRVFFADRVEDDKKVVQWRKRRKNFTSKKKKEKYGKILIYHTCPEDVQKELDKSKAKW
ncbi:unnamed protein product [Symbiodinium sp. CCMP2592]|nr:unnamed protein product [Symbiodinium sp. CCMP2592]